jgi:ParB family chromosome partitioning protein
MEIRISEIIIEDRVRVAYGWLDSLERSIEQVGVLQPIGITRDKKLIFGGRRLQACKNIGKETIPVRIFDVDADDPIAALRMEREENEHRKDLTPSEKVELARRIEDALAGRHGSNQYQRKEECQNFVTPLQNKSNNEISSGPPVGRSDEIAAAAVNMNRETYRQAKAVVDSGNREEIQAMDSGKKSINAAYNSIQKSPSPRTFKITLYKNPEDDAEVLLMKGGRDYCTKLAIAILKAAGHNIVSEKD